MSSALWWVTNGLAAAPPGITCSIGVSTSRNDSPTMKSRIAAMVLLRITNARRESSFMMRST